MSEAKDVYYKVILPMRSQNDTHGNYTDQYIKELESDKVELIQTIEFMMGFNQLAMSTKVYFWADKALNKFKEK